MKKCGLTTDPYCLKDDAWDARPATIPNIRPWDISVYMIHTPSPYTKEATKAFKGCIGADNFVEAGWVRSLRLHQYGDRFLVSARVRHSMAVRATLTSVWFVAEASGEIMAAHCDCMAGLGETCSHVACAMSAVARAVFIRKQSGLDACTSQKCEWLPPTQEVSAAMVRDIAFVRPSTKKKKALASSPSTPASKLPRTAMTSPNQQRNSDAFSSPSTPTRKLPHTSMTSPNQQRNSDAFSSPPTTPSRKAKLKSIPRQLKLNWASVMRHWTDLASRSLLFYGLG
ncbi:uncharacterized protein [Amphiura filiformis]|uniref:uncharacterized protein n=1 Tax=Amphiura filiformis TaxID=82378 RepID=UPI003B21EBD8